MDKFDLHGYTYDMAYAEAKKIFKKYKDKNFYEIEIICGKGQGVVRKAVLDCMNRYYRNYFSATNPIYGLSINTGTLIIKKRAL